MTEDNRQEEEGKALVRREYLDLKLASFRSEMRLLFVMAIAGNQVLSHLSLSPAVGAIGSGATILGAAAIKLLLLR